jgi:biopolymer transport protein ExbB/TolQ
MTPDGQFTPQQGAPVASRVVQIAVMLAFLMWIALILIPIAFAAAGIAWVAWRWRLWKVQARYSAASANVVSRADSASRV